MLTSALAMGIAMCCSIVLARFVQGVTKRAFVSAVAEAAAVGGAVGGRELAEEVAAKNGGDLLDWSIEITDAGFEVEVAVAVDGFLGRARAARSAEPTDSYGQGP